MTVPSLQLTQLKIIKSGHLILENISFTLPQGSFLAVIGPNGAGKTMLLNALIGLVPYEGEIKIFGVPPSSRGTNEMGFVPQFKNPEKNFPMTGIELVLSGLLKRWPFFISSFMRNKALHTMNQLGAAELADQNVDTLSGGQRQKLFLARSLIRNPKFLLLDEPSTGIDRSGEQDLITLLEEFIKNSGTLIMTTHDLNTVYHHASHVLLLQNRTQIAFGPPHESLNEEKLSRAFGHSSHNHPLSFNSN